MKKILVVDDDSEDLAAIKNILEGKRYNLSTAFGGKEALAFLENKSFDLILLDILMPDLSGYDLLKMLRARLGGKTKVAYVTIVPKSEVDMSLVDGFVQKPFDIKTPLC